MSLLNKLNKTMKKLFIYFLFSLAFGLFFVPPVFADVIPPNSHSLDKCVKIVNLNDFPNIILISYVTGPMVQGSEINQIKNNECLSKGYKFNSLAIYWSTKDKPNAIDQNNLLLDNVEVYGGYIDQNNPLVKENIEYSIAGYSGGKLVLYKSKQILEYNNGTPTKVETFTNPLQNTQQNNQNQQQKKVTSTPTPSPNINNINDQPNITPTPAPSPEPARGYWQSFVCFFRGLFGKGCQ